MHLQTRSSIWIYAILMHFQTRDFVAHGRQKSEILRVVHFCTFSKRRRNSRRRFFRLLFENESKRARWFTLTFWWFTLTPSKNPISLKERPYQSFQLPFSFPLHCIVARHSSYDEVYFVVCGAKASHHSDLGKFWNYGERGFTRRRTRCNKFWNFPKLLFHSFAPQKSENNI